MENMPTISVVIPNYNGKRFLKESLSSIINQNYNFLDVIIVDNASHDGSVEYLEENYPEVTIIQNYENLGFAAAVNSGIKASTTEYIFLVNNDVELDPNCISNLVECIEKNDKIFAVNSKMIQYHDREKMDDAGDEYTILGWTKRVGYNKSPDKYLKSREIFSACAGAALYKKNILDEIGYFDEKFFAYLEDLDISYRARIHGYQIQYCPQAIVYHIGSGTSGSQYNEFKIKLSARNNIYVPYKNMPWPQLLLNSPLLILGFLIKYLFFLKKGQGRAYLKGLKEGLHSLENIDKIRYDKKYLYNYLKIEWALIKNTIRFPFL